MENLMMMQTKVCDDAFRLLCASFAASVPSSDDHMRERVRLCLEAADAFNISAIAGGHRTYGPMPS